MQSPDRSSWIVKLITDFCLTSPANSLNNGENDRAFDAPIVGFSSGADPTYEHLKKDIGSFYLTPREWFADVFPEIAVQSNDLTVISYVLPFSEKAKAGNRMETSAPAETWARGKYFGELFNNTLRRHLAETLNAAGFPAVAPVLAPVWKGSVSERYGLASSWSERHAAYVSGLGTFGLCDGLITTVGKAMRCGSVIAKISLAPTARPYSNHHDYCLHFSRGACGQCISRCPVGAITEQGHDKYKCREYLGKLEAEHISKRFGFSTGACGLCQTGVSCENRIPDKQLQTLATDAG